jgi:hypothetical protein
MELMRLTRRGILLLILIFIVSLSIWFTKLSDKKGKKSQVKGADSFPSKIIEDDSIIIVNGTAASFESLVFLIFIEEDVDKLAFEKIRATVGVSLFVLLICRVSRDLGRRIIRVLYFT